EGAVAFVLRSVVSRDPQRGAGRAIVGNRAVVIAALTPGAETGDENLRPVWAHSDGVDIVVVIPRPLVAPHPQRGAGRRRISHRGVLEKRASSPNAPARHKDPGPVRAHRYGGSLVEAVSRAPVALQPRPGAATS